MTIALIDLDVICYSRGFAVEKTFYELYEVGLEHLGPVEVWEGKKGIPEEMKKLPIGIQSYVQGDLYIVENKEVAPVEHALHLVKSTMEEILVNTGATSYKGFLSGVGNFREKIATIKPYKGNRDKLHKPVHYEAIREYLVKAWKAEVVNGMEADDSLAMEQERWLEHQRIDVYTGFYTHPEVPSKAKTIICSVDKDLNQVPGWHYNVTTKKKYWVTEEEAIKTFWLSVLTGDPTDNIQGLKGVGPAKAAKILEGCKTEKEMYVACLKAYEQVMLKENPENAVWLPEMVETVVEENCKLLYLLRRQEDEWKAPL